MTYQLGDIVRIKETALSKSPYLKDAACGCTVGKLVANPVSVFGRQLEGCWKIQFEGGGVALVWEIEIEAEEQEA